MDLASSLLETQAKRQTQPGFPFVCDLPWMNAFEASFPHVETADQSRVIRDVKADLASTRPMDRLVCGDAGYGKTEIAMRAAFISVMNGRQAAVLAPTTILVEQHLETFRDRMADYPFRIEALSSFRSASERKTILDQLAAGAIDIVIGTHTLLQPGVVFKDLGLLVVDEEQRFGVTHKEALKKLRATVDILTLSATPIPRTRSLRQRRWSASRWLPPSCTGTTRCSEKCWNANWRAKARCSGCITGCRDWNVWSIMCASLSRRRA
jgi:transcription-repair coupling factor (superfamily II helicase)